MKWYRDSTYYKADTFGYEGLAEVIACIVSRNIQDFDFVHYDLCRVQEGTQTYVGCCCPSYLNCGESTISFQRVLEANNVDTGKLKELEMQTCFETLCSEIKATCGLSVSDYVAKVLLCDAIIMNEDRHLNNFNLIMKGNQFKLTPNFDNGLSLLSDLKDYPFTNDLRDNMKRVRSKPFLSQFDKQVKKLREMGFPPLILDYSSLLSELDIFTTELYSEQTIARCRAVVKNRLRETEGLAWIRK